MSALEGLRIILVWVGAAVLCTWVIDQCVRVLL